MKPLLLALSSWALAVPALAGDVFVGSGVGEVYRHGPHGTTLVFPTLCAAIDSLAGDGRTLYVADTFANVWKVRTVDGYAFDSIAIPAAANSMAVHNGALLTGSADGTIRRISPANGQVLGSWQVNSTLEAMVVSGDTVFAAGHNTFIYRGNALTGNFVGITACFGQVNSLVVHGDLLLAGGLDGRVYRFNKNTGQFLGQFQLANCDHAALGLDAGVLWTVDSTGFIRRVDPATGAILGSTVMCGNITAMAVLPECVADYNGDAHMNTADFGAFLNSFAAGEPRADVDRSGGLNVADFGAFMNGYAAGCP